MRNWSWESLDLICKVTGRNDRKNEGDYKAEIDIIVVSHACIEGPVDEDGYHGKKPCDDGAWTVKRVNKYVG